MSAPDQPSAFYSYLSDWRISSRARNIPNITDKNAAFLCHLLRQNHATNVLEIGSANGVSSAIMAHCIASFGGRLITIEISVPTHAEACEHFAALGLTNITAIQGDARLLLQAAPLAQERFDFIFIDAQKKQSHVFYERAIACATANAVIVVDDAWAQRDKMQPFYDMLAQSHQAYTLHFIDNLDATLVLRRSAK